MSEMINYKQILLRAGIEMQKRDLTVETWGNISVRDPETGHIYLTPSGMAYDTLKEEDVCVLDGNGNVIEGTRKPSVEKMLHVLVYQNRKDVFAILHTHPVNSTVFGVLHQGIPVVTDEMAQAIGGAVQCADYALPGSQELAENVMHALGNVQACLMANHGAVCVGKDMKECFKVATVLETAAEIYQRALTIGRPQEISKENTDWMRDFAVNHYGQK
jgi:Ribulose-5-phosphate 4-epimerase and related epimerases and aldolases